MTDFKLWKFNADFGRMGSLYGLFIATQEAVSGLTGKTVYFGGVLGKHSEVYITDFAQEFLEELPVAPETIQDLLSAGKNQTIIGYNPLEYVDEAPDEDKD